MGKIISIINNKGGVGKTTTAVNLAVGLHNKNYRILLIDLDAQCNASEHLGFVRYAETSFDIFEGKALPYFQSKSGVSVCPSSRRMAEVEITIAAKKSREKFLKKALIEVKPLFDFIVIDCPPSTGDVTTNALVASDSIIIPLQADFLAYRGIDSIIGLINELREDLNPLLEIEGVLLTMYNRQRILTKEIEKEIFKKFGSKFYQNAIRVNVALAEAPSVGLDIFTFAPQSNGATDYKEFVNEFLSHQK